MEGFVVAAVQMVGAVVVQEAVSRTISFTLGKRKEKASQGQYLERLRKAVHEVEFVLERTAKLPITEASLLRGRMELKRDFIEAAYQLIRHKKRQAVREQQQAESAQAETRVDLYYSVSSLIELMISKDSLCLSCDDVKRFEQFADSARNILRDVESGCSLRHWMSFASPPVRHLFEWKTLIYRRVQADQERRFSMWPARLEEERGVEAHIEYKYLDRKRPEKSFSISFVLRLSESTDIVGIAIDCMRSLASQFKLVADTAIGELTLLASLQDVSHSHAPPWVGIQERHNKIIRKYRPYPFCCKAKGHGPCANSIVSSELSHIFPEEVTFFKFEYSLLGSSVAAAGRRSIMRKGRRPRLELRVCLVPHYVHEERLQASYAAEVIGDNDEECIDVSIQQMGETVRSRAVNFFLRQPKMTEYKMGWVTKHGAACFYVTKKS